MRLFARTMLGVGLLLLATGAYAAEDDLKLPSHVDLQNRTTSPDSPKVAMISNIFEDAGWYIELNAVYVKPYFSNNSAYYGQPVSSSPGDESAVNVEFDYDFDLSGRLEGGYMATTSNLGWRARYWHFSSDATAPNHVAEFGVDPVNDAIAIGIGARMQDIDTFDSGHVVHELDLDVADAEVMRQFNYVLLSFGLRYADIQQHYGLNATTDEGSLLEGNMSTTGIGPTVAIGFEHEFGDSNWGVYAGGRGSLLFGDQSIHATSDSTIGPFTYDEDKPILNGEIQLGASWTGERFFALMGIEAQYWSDVGNMMNTNTSGGDGGSANGALFDSDIAFAGVTLSGGFLF